MEEWQATLAVVGNLIAFSILAVVIICDRVSRKSGRSRTKYSDHASGYQRHAARNPQPKDGTSRRVGRGETVSLPEHLADISRDRSMKRKKSSSRRGSGLTDTEVAVIITEAGRRD